MDLWQVELNNKFWVKEYFQIAAEDFDKACIKAKKIINEQEGHTIIGIQKMPCKYYE